MYTEFIQICTMFVVDFDRQHHIHLNYLVFQTKFVSTGKCEKYRFHGESSQNWRVSACPCVLLFPLRASQGCPSDPRSCARHTMWSNAAAGSACSPGARGTGKRRDFSTFTEGDAEDSDWAPAHAPLQHEMFSHGGPSLMPALHAVPGHTDRILTYIHIKHFVTGGG